MLSANYIRALFASCTSCIVVFFLLLFFSTFLMILYHCIKGITSARVHEQQFSFLVCFEVLQPSQLNGVMLSMVS